MVDSTGDNKPGEWPGNYISTQTIAYSCGILARAGETVVHAHDADELALCRRRAEEAAKIMADTYLGMSDESDHQFAPFFIAANVGDKVPRKLTEPRVRAVFRGTIWPKCQIDIEPLKEEGEWWRRASGQPLADNDEKALGAWRAMVAWFASQKDLHGASFVSINDRGESGRGEPISCVFPRMALALTKKGSLVGLFGCVVWT
jgi:hypothetical protein